MVRDELKRQQAVENGKKGGNPNIHRDNLVKGGVNPLVKGGVNQKRGSSYSFSTSIKENYKKEKIDLPENFFEEEQENSAAEKIASQPEIAASQSVYTVFERADFAEKLKPVMLEQSEQMAAIRRRHKLSEQQITKYLDEFIDVLITNSAHETLSEALKYFGNWIGTEKLKQQKLNPQPEKTTAYPGKFFT
jgi:hypothetical protein